jgi:tripartite-type tricarboxylate transporter receptor subunit TctC
MTRVRISLLVLCLLGLTAGSAAAQNWPSGPIRWLVGFAAGGTADMISRDIGSELEKVLGVPIVIENRPGANGRPRRRRWSAQSPTGRR